MATVEEVQHRASGFLQRRSAFRRAAERRGRVAEEPTDFPFQLFIPAQLEAAVNLAARFMEIANASPDADGLEAVLDAADAATRESSLELVKYALMVFITHHPRGRLLPIPPLERREPDLVPPSVTSVASRAALGPEAALDWFREDTWINDHHAKWHIVYPGGGQPSPQNPSARILRDRQGELFYYMHQQMLARYDTERAAVGLPLTQPLFDYTSPIPEGYLANLPGFSNRTANAVMRDLNVAGVVYRVADHTARRDRLAQAATTGTLLRGGSPVPIDTVSMLGATAESTIGSIDGAGWQNPLSFYGSHHNFGHVFIANLADPSGPNPTRPGVMTSTETAMRDPVFMRWHRHVDDHFFMWQQTHLPPYDFADAPPGVIVRKALAGWPAGTSPDILVCLQRDVAGATNPGFDGRVFAQNTFGPATWDQPRSAFPMLSDRLETRMLVENIAMPGGAVVPKPYLDHEDFFYFFRAENIANEDRPVTVRVFLAAAVLADNRRMWIEMDKFGVTLPAQQRVVVFRPSRLSSVVRKPAWRPGEPRPTFAPGTPQSARTYCDCGWPYHLLVPRGTAAGMPFRLMVMLTDWRVDRVGADSTCGSLSFCGARDTEYPDSRPMGYPFDRPIAAGLSVSQMLAHSALRHVASTSVGIRLL